MYSLYQSCFKGSESRFVSVMASLPMPGASAAGSGGPHPGQGFVTPPQAGLGEGDEECVMHTTRENIKAFFNPERYRIRQEQGGCKPRANPFAGMERHTTKENIERFFASKCPEKRPASTASTASTDVQPKAKARVMAKGELLEKFKLAAELNGFAWEDFAVSWIKQNRPSKREDFAVSWIKQNIPSNIPDFLMLISCICNKLP